MIQKSCRKIRKLIIGLLLFFSNIKESNGLEGKKELCVCDFTDKLNQGSLERKYITCNLNPSHGDKIQIIGNSNYVFECFKNSKIYCPAKNNHISNANISNHSKHLTYKNTNRVIGGKSVSVYELSIDENASDLLFYCFIKPSQISELLRGTVKIDLKREKLVEYSQEGNRENDVCDFANGNLNIGPSMGNYGTSRTVNCIHKIKVNKLFTLKLPVVDKKKENFVPQLLNCLSEYKFINFTMKEVYESDGEIAINVLFGNVSKKMNLTCTFDLSEYVKEPCSIGRKGNVTFIFTPQKKDSTSDQIKKEQKGNVEEQAPAANAAEKKVPNKVPNEEPKQEPKQEPNQEQNQEQRQEQRQEPRPAQNQA